MALFKPLKGTRASLDSQPLHDGYAYFCVDDGSFHIDYTDADGNLQRKQLNAKDAETVMGQSLIDLQPDWSINDPANPAYVQNRTHWVSVNHVTWFNNETIAFEAFNDAYNTQIAIDEPILNVGHTYTFVIDGTTFERVAYEFEGMTCLGNLSILDSSLTNTNELFLACSPLRDGVGGADGHFIIIATSLGGDSHTITMSADVTTYHKIDENYLPQIIGRPGERVGSEVFNDYENNFAGGAYAHAEGHSTWASGYASHTEGEGTQATFENAHAEGCETIASGSNAHAEGNKTTASNYNAHAEGNTTVASGHSSHAEGVRTEALGQGAHAEGQGTKASAWNSHAAGQGTAAAGRSQYVFGEYNIVDDTASGVSQRGKYIHIVGNGNSDNVKSNAHTLAWDGTAWFAGDVKIGGTGQDDVNAKTLATTEYVDSKATQADWLQNDETADDYIKNRTHWLEKEERIVEFNGDLTGREYVPFNETTFGVKVSDKVLTEADLIGSMITAYDGSIGELLVTADMIYVENGAIGVMLMNVPFVASVSDTWNGFSKGTYFLYTYEEMYTDDEEYYVQEMWVQSISCLTEEGSIYHQLDEKFIPDTIARKSDIGNIDLSNYYTKTEIDNLELITVEDIDAICGATIQSASEVMF